MTVLHSEDADWCVSMTTTEVRGRAERREEVERGEKMTSINPTCPDNNDTNILINSPRCTVNEKKIKYHAV